MLSWGCVVRPVPVAGGRSTCRGLSDTLDIAGLTRNGGRILINGRTYGRARSAARRRELELPADVPARFGIALTSTHAQRVTCACMPDTGSGAVYSVCARVCVPRRALAWVNTKLCAALEFDSCRAAMRHARQLCFTLVAIRSVQAERAHGTRQQSKQCAQAAYAFAAAHAT